MGSRDLIEKKSRTLLTVVMVVIGIAAIIALISQTQGISISIQKSLNSLGPTSIILMSTGSSGFSSAQADQILSLPNVSSVIPIIEGSANLVGPNQNSSVTVMGISSQGLAQLLGNVTLIQGSMYQDTISPSAVIGYDIAFPSSSAGKQNIFVGNSTTLEFRNSKYTVPVVGILNAYGTSMVPVDSGVIMSLPAAQAILRKTSFNVMLIKAKNIPSVVGVSAAISDIYGTNVRIITTQQIASTASSIIGEITILFVVIASVSLLVAAIGIMNIMLMSVMERTHEIGIMKAIGFTNRDVLLVFLFQALFIGFIGGVIGIGAGTGASYALASVFTHAAATSPSASGSGFSSPSGGTAGQGFAARGQFSSGSQFSSSPMSSSSLSYKPSISAETVIEAMLVAVIVSMLAGLYPAWRASLMEPITALQHL